MSEAPDYVAAIAGARAWRLAPNLWAKMGGFLWSHAMLKVWPNGGEMVAECDMGHPAPANGCSCGVYAWNDPDTMHARRYAPTSHEHISGVVAGAGRVIRGELGYWVAERAVVLAFFDDGYPSPVVEIVEGSGVFLATKEESRRKDHLLAAALERIPAIEPPEEAPRDERGSPVSASEEPSGTQPDTLRRGGALLVAEALRLLAPGCTPMLDFEARRGPTAAHLPDLYVHRKQTAQRRVGALAKRALHTRLFPRPRRNHSRASSSHPAAQPTSQTLLRG